MDREGAAFRRNLDDDVGALRNGERYLGGGNRMNRRSIHLDQLAVQRARVNPVIHRCAGIDDAQQDAAARRYGHDLRIVQSPVIREEGVVFYRR